jgi:CheY-like chemotaxis protein
MVAGMKARDFDAASVSILLIDSSAHSRTLLTGILRGAGFSNIRSVETVAEGLEAIRTSSPDVILVEWEAEGIDGARFTKRLRTEGDGAARAIPVVIITSQALRSAVETARTAGVSEYVIRPVSAYTLSTRLQEIMRNPRPFVDSLNYVGPCRRRRRNENYLGPFRRMTDPVEEFVDDPEEAEKKQRLRLMVQRLAGEAQNILPGDRPRLRSLFASSQETQDMALLLGDSFSERAAAALVRYLNGVGASSRLDPRVVSSHVDALNTLVELPNAAREQRESVVTSLDKLVQKKMAKVDAL